MVMVAHAWYPHLERELGWDGGERPASISPEIISLLLRSRLNYSGLVLCDDLEMGGVLAGRCIEEAAIGAIAAGCDVLLVCRHATNVQRVHQALVRESAKSFAFRTKLDTAARRVQQTKEARGIGKLDPELIVPDLADLRRDIQQLAQRAEIHP
jgi:beta-N-acetylhexosaminidase